MITVKIHDILHDEWDTPLSVKELERRLERTGGRCVEHVRIAKGYRNSPVFVTLDLNMATVDTIESTCRHIVRLMSHELDGINIDRTASGRNIKVVGR